MTRWIAPVLLGLIAWTLLSALLGAAWSALRALQRHRNGGPGR